MADWREQILDQFQPNIARLTLVADPDALLLEEGILTGIRSRGFDLIEFEDSIAFRYAYESQYRQRWDRGETTDLVVVLRAPSDDLRGLPYDLLKAGRLLSFSLPESFPKLSYPVVAQLDKSLLDPLYEALQHYDGGEMGDRATKEFILKNVFRIVPDLIKTPADLLKVLLERHYHNRTLPKVLDDHLIAVLRRNEVLTEWHLESIIPSREEFFTFLQAQWPCFLEKITKEPHLKVKESMAAYGSKPLDVPFGHDDVRVYLDNLFLEGRLHPVAFPHPELLPEWARAGVEATRATRPGIRLKGLLEKLKEQLPLPGASYKEWLATAARWAEVQHLSCQACSQGQGGPVGDVDELESEINSRFEQWLLTSYASLSSLPYLPTPVMVHHIPRYLAYRRRNAGEKRIALLVVDGLSLDQWQVIRGFLIGAGKGMRIEDSPLFAWIPTLTGVSRQALFAGEAPLYFGDSIYTTAKEPQRWLRFWEDSGLARSEVGFQKGLSDGPLDWDALQIDLQVKQVLGLVCDKIDKALHGMQLGQVGMYSQTKRWAEQGFLAEVIGSLTEHGFSVYLTSDHGNTYAAGKGAPQQGSLVESSGIRARIYQHEVFRSEAHQQFPDSLCWNSVGLPPGFITLLARGKAAFALEGEKMMAHGGASIEEVVVPFARIWQE